MPASSLSELNLSIENLSHSEEAIKEIQAFSESLPDTAARIRVFNATSALLRPPITCEDAVSLGFTEADDEFTLLQGDIVSTESAYFLGERVCSAPKYMVLNSSCDLAPGRREFAGLLRVKQVQH